MNRSNAIRTLVLVGALAVTAGTGSAREAPADDAASPEFAPAVAVSDVPLVAWHARTPAGGRIVAAVPADAPGTIVAPPGPGEDGAPAAVAYGDGSVLLLAARYTAEGSGVWSRVWNGRSWTEVTRLPRVDVEGHHPAAAGSADGAWAVWVSGDAASGLDDRLVASFWNGTFWSAPEPIPSALGSPMAPTIALDRHGNPVVLWAASDGNDAEIWSARRTARGWTAPRPVSDNDRHDIMPRAANTGGRITVAWTALERDGYVPFAARTQGQSWSAPRRLSKDPGNAPVVVGGDRPTVLWTRAGGRGRSTHLAGKELRGGRWQRLPGLGETRNARIAAAGAGEEIALAWHERGGMRVARSRAEGPSAWRLTDLRRSAAPALEALEVEIPGTYLGFGDSITEGLVRYEGEISYVEPYTSHLANLIADYVDVPAVSIGNAGVSGELTSEGTNRLAAELLSRPTFVLIMEGANDAANLLDAAVTAANLEFMVQRSLDQGVLPILALITPRTEFNFAGTNNLRIRDANALILQFAPLYRVQIVDQYSAFFRRADLYSDVLHPNEEGYAYMANVWFAGLRPILKAWLLELDEAEDAERDRDINRLGRHERRPRG